MAEIRLKKRYKYAGDIFQGLVENAGFQPEVAAALLNDIPDADVAPRAEVARDIVEFLFRRSESLQHLFKDNPDSAQCFRGRFELENAAITIANEYGVDLTKEEAEKALAERSGE